MFQELCSDHADCGDRMECNIYNESIKRCNCNIHLINEDPCNSYFWTYAILFVIANAVLIMSHCGNMGIAISIMRKSWVPKNRRKRGGGIMKYYNANPASLTIIALLGAITCNIMWPWFSILFTANLISMPTFHFMFRHCVPLLDSFFICGMLGFPMVWMDVVRSSKKMIKNNKFDQIGKFLMACAILNSLVMGYLLYLFKPTLVTLWSLVVKLMITSCYRLGARSLISMLKTSSNMDNKTENAMNDMMKLANTFVKSMCVFIPGVIVMVSADVYFIQSRPNNPDVQTGRQIMSFAAMIFQMSAIIFYNAGVQYLDNDVKKRARQSKEETIVSQDFEDTNQVAIPSKPTGQD